MIGCVQPAHIGTVVTGREDREQKTDNICTQMVVYTYLKVTREGVYYTSRVVQTRGRERY